VRWPWVLDAFEMVPRHRRPTEPLIFHSDRGSQYALDKFRDRLVFLGITPDPQRQLLG
jgi:transposase InsO family protein